MTDQHPPAPDPGPLDAIVTEQEDRQLMAAVILPNDGPLTPDQRQKVAGAVRTYMKRHQLSDAAVGKQVGLGAGTVYAATHHSGHLRPDKVGRRDEHLRELNMWMEADARRRATRPDEQFVRTKVAKKITNAAKCAVRYGSIAMCIGPTGIGKSMTAHYLYESFTGAIYVRLGRHLSSYTKFRNRLADVLKVLPRHRMQKNLRQLPVEERIFEKLRHSNRLLIIDEAHRLTDDGLEFLRDVYDETGVPLLLLCTIDLWDRIRRDGDEDHGQMLSRIGMCVTLGGSDLQSGDANSKLFGRDEIKRLFEAPKVKLHPDAIEYLHDVANALGQGSLRRCRELMKWAVAIARRKAGAGDAAVTITAALLEQVEAQYMDSQSGRQMLRERRIIAAAG